MREKKIGRRGGGGGCGEKIKRRDKGVIVVWVNTLVSDSLFTRCDHRVLNGGF